MPRSFRPFLPLAAVVLACLDAAGACAAPACLSPVERSAFEVAALKSDMMVAALECGDQDRYNAAVAAHRPEMLGMEDVLSGWFSRSYGARGQSSHDDYVTQMANVRSRASYRAGDGYCAGQSALFAEVEAPKSGMAQVAARRALGQPIRLSSCDGAGALPYDPPGVPARSRRPSRRHQVPRHPSVQSPSRPAGFDPVSGR